MLILTILIGFNLLIGGIAGFIYTYKEKGVSLKDIKVGTIVFIVLNLTFFWEHSIQIQERWGQLLLSWTIMCVGIVYGEKLRRKWAASVSEFAVKREKAETQIEDFVLTAEQYSQNKEMSIAAMNVVDDGDFREKLGQVKDEIHRLKRHAVRLNDPKMEEQLAVIGEACDSVYQMSEECMMDDFVRSKYEFLTCEIQELSQSMLTQVETRTCRKLNGNPFGALRLAVRAHGK